MNSTKLSTNSWLVSAALVLATVLAYWLAYQAGFIWDDNDYVTHNPVLRTSEGLWRIWFEPKSIPQYYPLVHTTFWLEYQAWGADPVGYHLVNVLVHALGACVVWRVLRVLELPGALLAAFVFALHPVHVESVAWVTERKNVLSGLFYLLALASWLRWRPLDPEVEGNRRAGVLTFALFIAALLCKTVTCSLPAAVLLLIYWKRGKLSLADWKASAPFLAVGLAFALVTAMLEKEHVGASGAAFDWSFAERVLIAGRALWFYVGKLVWPHPLVFSYERWAIDTADVVQWLYPAAAVGLVGVLFALRNRIGRGPLVAALFFGGSLLPALGFVNVFPMRYSFVADHFQYLASLGPIVLFASWAQRALAPRLPFQVRAAAVSAVLIALGVLTYRQCAIYEGHETLWKDTIEKNPSSWFAHNNLAKIYLDEGRKDEAVELLQASLELEESTEPLINLGVIRLEADDIAGARELFERAVKARPEWAMPHNALANAQMLSGDLTEAKATIEHALELSPGFAMARGTYGMILNRLEEPAEALVQLEQAMELNLRSPAVLAAAGQAAQALGKHQSALQYSANALMQEPQNGAATSALTGAMLEVIKNSTPAQAAQQCQALIRQLGPAGAGLGVRLVHELKSSGRTTQAQALEQALGG